MMQGMATHGARTRGGRLQSLRLLSEGFAVLLSLLAAVEGAWGHEAKAPYQEAVRAYSENRDPEALEAITRTLDIYPNYAEAHFLQGLIYSRQHKAADAITSFQKAISIYPNYAEARYQ